MKKTIVIFLFGALFFVGVGFASESKQQVLTPVSVSKTVDESAATDLKLAQQKLEFFKERLDFQDKRIGDIGLYLAIFGALMTVIVVFFSLSSKREAVLEAKEEAKKEAREEVERQAKTIIEGWLSNDGRKVLTGKVDALLKPEVEKALHEIKGAAAEILNELEAERQKAHDHNAQLDELISRGLDKDNPLSKEQRQQLDATTKNLEAKPQTQYRYEDWFMLGVKAFEAAKYETAADHFTKAAELADDPQNRARTLYSKGVTLGLMDRSEEAIAVYDEVVKRYGDAPEAALREVVAKALVNRGYRLGQLGRSEEAIVVCDEVLKRYGGAPEVALRKSVAMALRNKGVTLGQMERREEEIAVYNEIVNRYGDVPEEVAKALNGWGFTLLCEAKKIWQGGDGATAIVMLKQALEKIEAALQRKPDEPMFLGNQGYILLLLNKVEEARPILAKAIALGGEELRQGELNDADIHPLPQDKAFKALIESL